MSVTTPSKLQKMIASGNFAVTSEVGPPRSADGAVIEHKGNLIKDYVDAINVTDNQTSVCRVCSLACCIRLKLMGLEPCLQMVTRDRNRIALQSDILGAASFGINNILCLTGDHQHFGDHPKCANVFDLDSVQLIQTVKMMRDEGKLLGGFEFDGAPPDVHRRRGQPLRRAQRGHAGVPAGQESGGRGAVRPDPVHLQHGHLQRVHETDGGPGFA